MAADLPRLPSDYCHTNYFIGASFQAHFEAEAAVLDGAAGNVMWGSDYPHPEGTYRYTENTEDTPITHLALRSTFAGLPADATQAMLSGNAVRVYGLEAPKLQAVADRINAPTLDELAVDPKRVVQSAGASREIGVWWPRALCSRLQL